MLESELKRHKTQLAANADNEDLLSFFLRDNSEDVSYIDDLKNRVASVMTIHLLLLTHTHPCTHI